MPVIETTLIEGYDADTKARLMKGMARVVLSVMAASPDGITTVIREVAPSSYARGGVSRVPGPPLPPAVDLASAFATALTKGDRDAIAPLVAEHFTATDEQGKSVDLAALLSAATGKPRSYSRFDEALTEDGIFVFAEGTIGTAPATRFIERYTVSGRTISAYAVWMTAA